MKQIFDLQFWVIMIIFAPILWFGGKKIKAVLIDTVTNTVSSSVSDVVKDQWAAMFLKLDEYRATVNTNTTDIEQLKKDCEELQGKAKLNREDIEKILEKVRNLK
jgi:peptidoglycan hydrolase CwlO-like protein